MIIVKSNFENFLESRRGIMKKFNINEPDKCDNCHNRISGEFFDTEYNGVTEPIKVCPACFKKGKCNNTIHYKNIDGFWYKVD